MRLSNSLETYGLIHQSLHWSMAILILALFPLGIYMHELPDITPDQISSKVWLYSLHKTLGMLAFALAVIRVIFVTIQPHPRALHGGMEGFGAKTVHILLYGTIIAMPIFGWLHHAAAQGFAPIWWPFSQDLPFIAKDVALSNFFKGAHFITGILLGLSILLHVAGALKHVVIDKDKTLSRMVPGAYVETGTPPEKQPKQPLAYVAAFLAFAIAVVAIFIIGDKGTDANTPITAQNAPKKEEATQTAQGSDNEADTSQNASESIPGSWNIDHSVSKLEIDVTQLGSPVKGTFSDWKADVVFDPEDLESASINASVNTTSLSIGEVSARAMSDEFLNSDVHSSASFVSNSISKTEDGYSATGTLTLAGIEKDFTINFTFEENDGRAIVSGEADIQRLDFDIGKAFADDSSVGRVIKLMINIEANRR